MGEGLPLRFPHHMGAIPDDAMGLCSASSAAPLTLPRACARSLPLPGGERESRAEPLSPSPLRGEGRGPPARSDGGKGEGDGRRKARRPPPIVIAGLDPAIQKPPEAASLFVKHFTSTELADALSVLTPSPTRAGSPARPASSRR